VTEIEHIQAILRSGPESFIEFVEEALKVLGTLDESTEMLDDENRVKELFRALHSLKGAARYMELRNFAAGLHETENLFAALRDGARKPDAEFVTEVRERLKGLYQEVENIKKINDRFKEFATQDGVQGLFAGSVRGFFENIQRMAADISAELSGRGIGLDVVHDTVKRLGGSVAIASRRGIGTRIALTVPLEASESDANEPTEQES